MKIEKIVSIICLCVLCLPIEGFSSIQIAEESVASIVCVIPGTSMNQQSYHVVNISEVKEEPGYANVLVREWLRLNYLVPPKDVPAGVPKESKLRLRLEGVTDDGFIQQYYGEESDSIQLLLHVSFSREDSVADIFLAKANFGGQIYEGKFACTVGSGKYSGR